MMVRMPRPSSPTRTAQAPSSSISDDAFERLPSLSFRRCSRKSLRVPSSSTRGTRKQVRPASVLGEHEEDVAHRRRAEPLVPGEPVGVARRSGPPGSATARVVLARTSEPPCFSVMPMPAISPALSAIGDSTGVVRARGEARHPARGHVGSAASAGAGGIRHRDRAAVAGLDLRPHDEAGGAAHVGAAAGGAGPRLGGEAVADGHLEQAVAGRVELDLVDPVAGGSWVRSTGVTRSAWSAHCRTSGVPASAPRSSSAAAPCRVAGATQRSTASARAGRKRSSVEPAGGRDALVTTWVRTPRGYGGYGWHHDRGEAAGAPGARARSGPARARPARRHDHPHLLALPRHRAGRRGRLLRPALAAAAHPRAVRRPRLRRQRHRARTVARTCVDRSTDYASPLPHRPTSSTTPSCPPSRDVLRGRALRPLSIGFLLVAVVGVARAERLRRHHLDHVRPVGRARHRAHPRAVVHALRRSRSSSASSRSRWCCSGRACSATSCRSRWDCAHRALLAAGHRCSPSVASRPCTTSRTPRRSPWLRDVPGAVLTLVIWFARLLRRARDDRRVAGGGTSIYGPLSAPIVLLIWLYALAIAVLIGAALNAVDPRALAGRRAPRPARAARRVGRSSMRAAPHRAPGPAGRLGRPVRRLRLRADDDDLGLVGPARGRARPADPHVRRRARAAPRMPRRAPRRHPSQEAEAARRVDAER